MDLKRAIKGFLVLYIISLPQNIVKKDCKRVIPNNIKFHALILTSCSEDKEFISIFISAVEDSAFLICTKSIPGLPIKCIPVL